MKVLFKWEDCDYLNCDLAYYLEIPKKEITDELYALFENNRFVDPVELQTGEYFDEVNRFASGMPELATKDCAYVLIDESATKAVLCDAVYPYSGMWNDGNPFRRLYKTEKGTEVEEYLKHTIEIKNFENLKNLDDIIAKQGYRKLDSN
jgi:hypothetical protein